MSLSKGCAHLRVASADVQDDGVLRARDDSARSTRPRQRRHPVPMPSEPVQGPRAPGLGSGQAWRQGRANLLRKEGRFCEAARTWVLPPLT